MGPKTFPIVAAVVAVALAGMLGLTGISAGSGSGDSQSGVLRHLHGADHRLHGGGHHQHPMEELIARLELTPDQQRHLDRIHEILGSHHDDGPGSMAELHEELVVQFERGPLETDAIRRIVDRHVESMREVGYGITDELVALVNGLDAKQREILSEHLHGH